MALADPLHLQATLVIAAISRSLLHKQKIGLEVYFYQAETIRLLKDRLNEPNLVITDAIICAVGCLMQLEVGTFHLPYFGIPESAPKLSLFRLN